MDVMVGANGVNMRTLGMMQLHGRIVSLAGDQVNISSNNEVLVDGGKLLKLTADNIEISPRSQTVGGKEYKNMALDGSFSTSSNAVFKGGAHVEGDLSAQSISAVKQYNESEVSLATSSLIGGMVIGRVVGNTVFSVATRDFAVSALTTTSAGPAINLYETNDDLRAAASSKSGLEPVSYTHLTLPTILLV